MLEDLGSPVLSASLGLVQSVVCSFQGIVIAFIGRQKTSGANGNGYLYIHALFVTGRLFYSRQQLARKQIQVFRSDPIGPGMFFDKDQKPFYPFQKPGLIECLDLAYVPYCVVDRIFKKVFFYLDYFISGVGCVNLVDDIILKSEY